MHHFYSYIVLGAGLASAFNEGRLPGYWPTLYHGPNNNPYINPNSTFTNSTAGSLLYETLYFGSLESSSVNSTVNTFTCSDNTGPLSNCFVKAVTLAMSTAANGVSSVQGQNSANIYRVADGVTSMNYVNQDQGQGNNTATQLGPTFGCLESGPSNSTIYTNGFTLASGDYGVKVTCKSACWTGALPSMSDLQYVAASVAQNMVTLDYSASRTYIGFNETAALARCRVTLTRGDGKTLSACPDFLPPGGCGRVDWDGYYVGK